MYDCDDMLQVVAGAGDDVNDGAAPAANAAAAAADDANAGAAADVGHGILSLGWTFIVSFFSSLAPQPPAPVNANWLCPCSLWQITLTFHFHELMFAVVQVIVWQSRASDALKTHNDRWHISAVHLIKC